MNWIIKVDNLSKVYRLGSGASHNGTLYEQISKRIKSYFPNRSAEVENTETSSERKVVSDEQTLGLPPGYFWALKDISFEVRPGERIGLIGQNGSGKSTLLKILSRITTQSHGEFRYRGHLISLLEVGTGFHPELSGRENIYLNAAINGISNKQIKERFKSIVDFSELGAQIDTPVKRYSSGMYMRLAFSVAAFLESEILLIDEVLAVGDSDFQKKCKEKMLEVANEGRSVIFVSHDMSAIESICKKTIEISHGKIVAINDIVPSKKESDAIESQETLYLSNSKTIPAINLCAETTVAELANSNDKVQMISCSLLNGEDQIREYYTVNEHIQINVQFQIKTRAAINLRVDLSSSGGVNICSSMDHHLFNARHERKNGIYEQKLVIPKHYLNEGQFIISLVFILDNEEVPFKNILSFEVVDNNLPEGVRSNWQGAWPESLLRPDFKWSLVDHKENIEEVDFA